MFRIELRAEDKQEYEELKKLAAKNGGASQSAANEQGLESPRKHPESRAARIGISTDD